MNWSEALKIFTIITQTITIILLIYTIKKKR